MHVTWPDGKAFAFTVFDDTDLAVPGNFERVYDLAGIQDHQVGMAGHGSGPGVEEPGRIDV